jgi:hypothetical protein
MSAAAAEHIAQLVIQHRDEQRSLAERIAANKRGKSASITVLPR